MTKKMSIRELSRSGKEMELYDYIEIEDRKSHQYKGVFVPARYADEVKDFLARRMMEEKRKRKEELLHFAGILSGETEGMSAREIRERKVGEM